LTLLMSYLADICCDRKIDFRDVTTSLEPSGTWSHLFSPMRTLAKDSDSSSRITPKRWRPTPNPAIVPQMFDS
jgi:hypothetical protein